MIRFQGTIYWPGGRTQEIIVTQQAWVDWKLYAVRHGLDPTPTGSMQVTLQRYCGYAAVQRAAGVPRNVWPEFEDWEAEDVDLEPITEDEPSAAHPSPAVRSAG